MCVLPGWQMNVNVNVNVAHRYVHEAFTRWPTADRAAAAGACESFRF